MIRGFPKAGTGLGRVERNPTSNAAAPTDPVNVWPAILRPDSFDPPADPLPLEAAVTRLAELAPAALAAHLLEPAARRLDRALIDPAQTEQSRLFNRFTRAAQTACLEAITQAGIDLVVLKGFANAHTLYPDPDVRVSGDLDILVREADRDRVIAELRERGFRFVALPPKPWGFISTASYMPFLSADGACNLDIHIHPDCYPVHRSLTTEMVFAAARTISVGRLRLNVPAQEHTLLLLASNAAKEKFGRFSLKNVLDAIVLLRRHEDLDWLEIAVLARRGRYLKPLRVFLALLVRLGLPQDRMPEGLLLPPGGLTGAEFERILAGYETLFPAEPGWLDRLRRELLLATEPKIGLYNNWLRLRGLFAPKSGIPEAGRDVGNA